MNKLTADRCRQQILRLKKYNSDGHMTLNEWEYLEAFEIALPILEQQEHGSIIAEQLEAVRESLELNPHQNAIISCAIDRINLLTARTLELSRSLIKQQERGEGEWIEWVGGEMPVSDKSCVDIRWIDGSFSRNTFAAIWDWEHHPGADNIIAYRIIPERG